MTDYRDLRPVEVERVSYSSGWVELACAVAMVCIYAVWFVAVGRP